METYHWFLLGIMVAFTPSLLVLSVLLARSVDQPADTDHFGECAQPLTPLPDRSSDQPRAQSHHKAVYREAILAKCSLPAAMVRSKRRR